MRSAVQCSVRLICFDLSSHCMGVAKIFGLRWGRERGKSNDESVPISDS